MLFLLIACACSEQAVADGSAPFPDGRPSDLLAEPADDLGAVAELEESAPVEAVSVVEPAVVEAPSTLLDVPPDLMEASGLTAAEVAAVQVIVRAAASEVAARRPPGMGVPWYERYADEVALVLLALIGMAVRRLDLSRLDGRMGRMADEVEDRPMPIPTPSVDVAAIERAAVERSKLREENARLSAAVTAHAAELARVKATERLAAQTSISDEIVAMDDAARRWMLE